MTKLLTLRIEKCIECPYLIQYDEYEIANFQLKGAAFSGWLSATILNRFLAPTRTDKSQKQIPRQLLYQSFQPQRNQAGIYTAR